MRIPRREYGDVDKETKARADYERGKAKAKGGGDWSDRVGQSDEYKAGFDVGKAERKADEHSKR